jgi:hypothetical protein
MSTSAESAQQWVLDKKPSKEEIQNVIDKLEKRIDEWDGDEDEIQGSIEAVLLLQQQFEPVVTAASPETNTANLDTAALIPESTPIELSADVKMAAFEALKKQLGNVID